MLFDLKGKRKRLVQVVTWGSPILFGGSLVLFGRQQRQRRPDRRDHRAMAASYQRRLREPGSGRKEGGPLELPRASRRGSRSSRRLQPRGLADRLRCADRQLTRQGKQAVLETITAWERYLKLKPKKPDAAHGPVRGDRIRSDAGIRQVGEDAGDRHARATNANSYFQLAHFAYRAVR
jgi:hypothetical protein